MLPNIDFDAINHRHLLTIYLLFLRNEVKLINFCYEVNNLFDLLSKCVLCYPYSVV